MIQFLFLGINGVLIPFVPGVILFVFFLRIDNGLFLPVVIVFVFVVIVIVIVIVV